MKTKTLLTATVGLALVAGCLPSLNPVYEQGDLVFEPALLGTWGQQNAEATWEFTRRGDTGYRLVFTDKKGRSGHFQAHLARVGDLRLLDLYPEKGDVNAAAFYQFHLVPIHSIYIVERKGENFELRGMDNRWLDEYLTSHPEALPYVTYNDHKLVTASTSQLQSFVLEHRERFTARFKLEPMSK